MLHELSYDQENDVAVLAFKHHYLAVEVEPIFKKIEELLQNSPYRQVVVIMSDNHNVENRETREKTSELLSKINVSDVAFVGGSAANRMIAKVLIKTGMIKLSGDFFKNYDEAINWLKSKR